MNGQLSIEQQHLVNQLHSQLQHQIDSQSLNNPSQSQSPSQSMSTTTCVYCSTQLSYPHNAIFIECPKCSNTMNPQAPQTNYMNCIGCGTLLSYPPTSNTIQCPKCLMVMNLQSVRNNSGASAPTPPAPDDTSSQADGDNHSDENGSKKSRKKRKDPNAPKRASNAYMIFCKERRAQLKEDRPDLQFGKLGARLGEIWRQMSAEDKKPYENRASSDRERYKKEMTSYQAHSMIKQQAHMGGAPGEEDEGDEDGSEEEEQGEQHKRRKHSHIENDESHLPLPPHHGNDMDQRALAQLQYNMMDPMIQQQMALQLQQQQHHLQQLTYQLQQQSQQHSGSEGGQE